MTTQREIVMEAARSLKEPFTYTDLLVKAWMNCDDLGLPGRKAEYPDARKLQNLLYGKRGLIRQGLLVAVEGGYAVVVKDPEPIPVSCPGGCGGEVSERDRVAFGGRCEDCFAGNNARG